MKYNYKNYGTFKNISIDYRSSWQFQIRKALKIKNRYLKFIPKDYLDKNILEIGCGDGSFLHELQNEGYKKLIGIEPSKTYKYNNNSITIFHTDALSYLSKCKNKSIDAIIAFDVFEHIPFKDLVKVLHLAGNKLKPNGIIVIRTPNLASPFGLLNYFGDISHTTPLNQSSISQLVFGSVLKVKCIYKEPFAFPTLKISFISYLIWFLVECLLKTAFKAFGPSSVILTPNIIIILQRENLKSKNGH